MGELDHDAEKSMLTCASEVSPLVFGIGIYFSIPKSFTSGQRGAGEGSVFARLARMDYPGAITLVRFLSFLRRKLTFPDNIPLPISFWTRMAKSSLDTNCHLCPTSHRLRLHRALRSSRSNRSRHRFEK